MAHPELGLKILQRIADEVSGIAIVESAPRQDGRNMTMVLHPITKGGRRPKPAGSSTKSAAPSTADVAPESEVAPEAVAAATEESGAA